MITAHPAIGGLGLDSIEIEQMVESINLFILLYQLAIPMAYLLRESLELMQLESNLDQPVLEVSYKVHSKLVTYYWLSSLWLSNSTFSLSL